MYNHNRDKNRFEHKVRGIELLTEQISAKHLFYGTSGLFFLDSTARGSFEKRDRIPLPYLSRRDSNP